MAANSIQTLKRTAAAVAVFASLASPAVALAPEIHRLQCALSHGSPAYPWSVVSSVYAEIEARAGTLDAGTRTRVAWTIVAEAARSGLDPFLVVAMIQVESGFRARAVSSAGAVGLMQLLASTMRDVAKRAHLPRSDVRDPVANVQAGARYLATLMEAFGDAELALMAYNAGPGRIRGYMRSGEIPERFWIYPHVVRAELGRIGGAITRAKPPIGTELAARFRPAHRRIATAIVHSKSLIARTSKAVTGASVMALRLTLSAHSIIIPSRVAVARSPLVFAAGLEPAAAAIEQVRDRRRAPRPVEPERGVPPGWIASRRSLQSCRVAA